MASVEATIELDVESRIHAGLTHVHSGVEKLGAAFEFGERWGFGA